MFTLTGGQHNTAVCVFPTEDGVVNQPVGGETERETRTKEEGRKEGKRRTEREGE